MLHPLQSLVTPYGTRHSPDMSDEPGDKNLGVVSGVFEAQLSTALTRFACQLPSLKDRIASGETSTLNLEFDL